jgi:N6-adenosine-specific RNA methylase IME4
VRTRAMNRGLSDRHSMSIRPHTIVVDPPWPYPGGFNGFGKRRALPYRSMTVDEIARLPIDKIVAREGYVFLWTTNKYLGEAFRILAAWKLTYRQTIIWCKPDVGGLGGMFGTNVEFVLVAQRINLGTNGHGVRTKRDRVTTSWFEWPASGEHSEKPAAFYSIVERVAPGPYLDVFARHERDGWICIGDEIDGRCVNEVMSAWVSTGGIR